MLFQHIRKIYGTLTISAWGVMAFLMLMCFTPPSPSTAEDSDCDLSLIQTTLLEDRRIVQQQPNTRAHQPTPNVTMISIREHQQPLMETLRSLPLSGVTRPLSDFFVYELSMPIIWVCCTIYLVSTLRDVMKLWRWRLGQPEQEKFTVQDDETEQPWPVFKIAMLCFYRIYTGFLAATWLPYLLALEGQNLWAEKQSLFMAYAKLIYGITVLLNPIVGLLGDMLAEVCQGAARRLWIFLGILLSAFGILLCLKAAGDRREYSVYIMGLIMWRLGEALNDVTTEAIVPEMVPAQQFSLASSIKAASFLIGALGGYAAIAFMRDVNYTWMYFAYLACMFVCAIPPLLLITNDVPAPASQSRPDKSFSRNMVRAYVTPSTIHGGFPQACLATFISAMGTAPMFFFLLILRDFVGVHKRKLVLEFAFGSLLFFVAAAVATALDFALGGRISIGPAGGAALDTRTPRTPHDGTEWHNEKIRRLKILACVAFAFGLSIVTMDWAKYFASRELVFFSALTIFGLAFGLGFSRFQDMTWRLLPSSCDIANAMGFFAMCRNAGLGLGNFLFGAVLDLFDESPPKEHTPKYAEQGYSVMFYGCMVLNIVAGLLAYRITWLISDRKADAANGSGDYDNPQTGEVAT